MFEDYEIVQSISNECLSCKRLKIPNKKRTVVYTEIFFLTEKSVNEYCNFYKKVFDDFVKIHSNKPKFRLILIFDIRKCVYTEWVKTLVPFISIHNSFKEKYKLHLAGSIVFLNSTKTKTILDTLFSTLYFPARPIEFVIDETIDKKNYIENFWSIHS